MGSPKLLLSTLLFVGMGLPVAAQEKMSWPMFLPAIVVQGSCSDSQDFTVCSTSFKSGARLSDKYTLDGQNVSPQLSWVNAPEGTDAFGLFVSDPDGGNWIHWMVKIETGALQFSPVPGLHRYTGNGRDEIYCLSG